MTGGPGHLVLSVLVALANQSRGSDGHAWATADCLTGEVQAGRSASSVASSCATAVRHSWACRRQVGKMPYYEITGAGLAELRQAGFRRCPNCSRMVTPGERQGGFRRCPHCLASVRFPGPDVP